MFVAPFPETSDQIAHGPNIRVFAVSAMLNSNSPNTMSDFNSSGTRHVGPQSGRIITSQKVHHKEKAPQTSVAAGEPNSWANSSIKSMSAGNQMGIKWEGIFKRKWMKVGLKGGELLLQRRVEVLEEPLPN